MYNKIYQRRKEDILEERIRRYIGGEEKKTYWMSIRRYVGENKKIYQRRRYIGENKMIYRKYDKTMYKKV